jgi:hypothetical protein
MDIGLAAKMHNEVVRLQMPLHIERANRTFRGSDEAHCAVKVSRNGCAAPFSVGLKPECLQRLIELRKIAGLQIHLQIGERIAVIHAKHAADQKRRPWRLHIHRLDVHNLRAPVVVRVHDTGHRNILARSPARHACRRKPEVCVYLHRAGDILCGTSPLHLDGAIDRGVQTEVAVVLRRSDIHDGAQRNALHRHGEIRVRPLHGSKRH